MSKIREGYKETEIGIIPEDWEINCLSEIGSFRKGKGIKKDDVVDSGIQCIRYGEIYTDYNHFVINTKSFISEEIAINSVEIEKGDLVLAGSGETLEDIGKAIAYLGDEKCYVGGDTIIIKPNSYINSLYLSYFLATKQVYSQKRKLGQGNSIVHLYLDGAKQIKVYLPPLIEQQHIAEILFTMDAHIEKLDQTIEDYKLLKKGVMKKLLTEGIGHTEFKETEIGRIPKEWEVVSLNSLGDTFNGLSGVTKDDFGSGVPYITYMNIFSNTRIDLNRMDYVDLSKKKKQNKVKYGDVFFTTSSETPEEAGMSSVLLDEVSEMYLNSFCFGYRLFNFDLLKPEFARFLLRFDYVRKEIQKLAQGSTRFNLSKANVLKIKVALPTIDEQLEIANRLEYFENRVQLLMNERDDFLELKKALMEKLLTGNVRVAIRMEG